MFRQLHVLDYFDFWMKVDDDARWAGKFPGDITHHLVSKRRIFFHMGGFLQVSLPTERHQRHQSCRRKIPQMPLSSAAG